ncbi:hypothetical protein [Luteolibacter sp. Populi]|uniref:hypothetical protein n=1 Tax=Luteolibacter sp. Populi TaxID=3230487 RepID=UPI00346673D7
MFLLGLGGLFVAWPRALKLRDGGGLTGESPAAAVAGSAGTSAKQAKSSRRSPGPDDESDSRILEALRSTDAAEHALALETLLPEFIRRDPHAAMDLVLGLKSWERREATLLAASGKFGAGDPAVAIGWLNKVEDETEKRICRAAACRRMIATVPETAMMLAESDPGLVTELAGAWVSRSPDEALRWIAAHKDPEQGDRLWAAGLLALAEKSPERAANLAVDHIDSEHLQAEAVISVLHQWVLQDRKAAAEWVELFPEGPLRARAEGELSGTH